jgi:hypothetical protein
MIRSTIATLAGCALLGSAGCRGTTLTPLVSQTFPSHEREVCILEGKPPPEVEYLAIADIEIEFNSYGGDKKAKTGLAKQARKIGADAVISVELSNFLGAPTGIGQAIRFKEGTKPPAGCEWF